MLPVDTEALPLHLILLNMSVSRMSVDDVVDWIKQINPVFAQYETQMRSMGLDGEMVLLMEEADLEAAPMSMSSRLHRKRFMNAVSELKKSGNGIFALPTSTGWTCQSCTLRNDEQRSSCSACATARGLKGNPLMFLSADAVLKKTAVGAAAKMMRAQVDGAAASSSGRARPGAGSAVGPGIGSAVGPGAGSAVGPGVGAVARPSAATHRSNPLMFLPADVVMARTGIGAGAGAGAASTGNITGRKRGRASQAPPAAAMRDVSDAAADPDGDDGDDGDLSDPFETKEDDGDLSDPFGDSSDDDADNNVASGTGGALKKQRRLANGMQGLSVCAAGTLSMSRAKFEKVLRDAGMRLTSTVTKANHCVIGTSSSLTDPSSKILKAKTLGLSIVSEQWVHDSIASGKPLPLSSYLIRDAGPAASSGPVASSSVHVSPANAAVGGAVAGRSAVDAVPATLWGSDGPRLAGYPWGLNWESAGSDGSVLVLNSSDARVLPSKSAAGTIRIASFDLDHTLVYPKSGKKFPTSRTDWQWFHQDIPQILRALHSLGYLLVIFSNQNGIGSGKQTEASVTMKILDICKDVGVPMRAFLMTGKNQYRKPNTLVWDMLVEQCAKVMGSNNPKKAKGADVIDFRNSFYIGDAAGRPAGWSAGAKRDFSCSDRQFAHNVALADSSASDGSCVLGFSTPEEFFERKAEAKFHWRSADPSDMLREADRLSAQRRASGVLQGMSEDNGFTNSVGTAVVLRPEQKTQELVVFCGSMASGKSSWAKTHLVAAHGYEYVNQDLLKTRDKCVRVAREALSAGKSVVVDNTNRDKPTRRFYLDLAKKAGVPCRCFHFQAPRNLIEHLNLFREKVDPTRKRLSSMLMNMFFSRFEEPTASEGFAEICTVAFVPQFKTERERRIFLQFT